ncbi:MAG: flagella basal body P-ring formation protein FlgA [Myxococcales bacterium]|nr:flagella basal body P-ring formation protein FlgA [Myxococcales bacterium]
MHPPLALPCAAVALALAVAPSAGAADPPPEIEVEGTRIALSDVVTDGSGGAATLDLGVAPAAGGARLLTRAEVLEAWRQEHGTGEPPKLPASVRVTRKTKRLGVEEQRRIVERGLAPLPPGVRLDSVKPHARALVPTGWQRSSVTIGRLPQQAGTFRTTARVELWQDGQIVSRLAVPVELEVSEEAARPDIARGASLTVVVRRGAVEIGAAAVAGTDGRVGDVVQVTLRATNRVVRATLLSSDRALLEGRP